MCVPYQVSCGGCHTLILAKARKLQNGDLEDSWNSDEAEDDVDAKPDPLEAIRKSHDLSGSFDLSGSISARNRRREKLPVS